MITEDELKRYKEILKDATEDYSHLLNDWEHDWCHSNLAHIEQYGLNSYMSEKQKETLDKIEKKIYAT